MKKRNVILFLFIFVLLFTSSVLSNAKLTYFTKIERNSDQIKVKIKLEDIEQDKIIISLPNLPQETSNHDAFNYSNYLSDLKIYDDKNNNLEVEYKDDLMFIEVNKELTYIEYSVDNKIYSQSSFHSNQAKTWIYFTDSYGYYWSYYVYLVPDSETQPSSIHLKFDLPDDWKVMAPFKKEDDYYAVENNDVISYTRQLVDSAFYMGEVDYYAESSSNNTKHHIARMAGDDNKHILMTKQEATEYMNKVSRIYDYFVDYFDHNPYPVVLWRPNFKDFEEGIQYSPGFGYMGNGWHYWPEGREFEITCHVVQSWISRTGSRPLIVNSGIEKGFGEYYMGYLSSYELFNNDFDLAKMYYTYLVYDRAPDQVIQEHFEYEFIKGFALAIYLDNKIKEISDDKYSLKDVMQRIYDKYYMTKHKVTYQDIQDAIFKLTGNKMETDFNKYVYGDDKIPAYQYISGYKKYFENIIEDFNQAFYFDLHDNLLPLFINIEMTLQNNHHIMSGIFANVYSDQFANYIIDNYNIQQLTKANVEETLYELTGNDCSGFFTYWEDTYGVLTIEKFKEWLYYKKNN